MATIKDVAKLANVSVSTVSLMINGKKNISQEKYDRILKAMAELKYRPNYIAQNLKKQNVRLVGVILPSPEGHYSTILRGIAKHLQDDDCFLITKLSDNHIQTENEAIEHLTNIGVSGLLMVPCEPDNVEKYESIQQRGTPIVFIERKVSRHSFSNVLYDNKNIIYQKTRELLQQYRPADLMLVCGPLKYGSESDCAEGFREALREVDPQGNVEPRIEEVWQQKEHAFNMLYDRIVTMERPPACVLVSDYSVAEALYEIFTMLRHDGGIYALAGDDWTYSARRMNPVHKLSRESERVGVKSAELLMKFIRNKMLVENRNIVVDSWSEKTDYEALHGLLTRKETRLRVLLFETNAMDALVKLSASFEKVYGIRPEFNILPYLELKAELVRQSEGGSDYDVVMMDLPWIKSVEESGYLLDIRSLTGGDAAFLDDYPDGIKKVFFEKPGQLSALPVIATTQALFYRDDLFQNKDIKRDFYRKYGFDLRPPKTWTEFNFVAEFFNRTVNPHSPVEYGTAICGLRPTGIVEEFLPRQWAFNGRIVDKRGRVCLESDENIRALESLVGTFQNVPAESAHWFFDDLFKKILSGDVAMVQGFATHYTPYKYSDQDNIFDHHIRVDAIPGGKPMLGAWALGIPRNSRRAMEAYVFMRWLSSSRMAVHYALMGGAVPTRAVCNNTLLKSKYPWLGFIDESFSNMGMREVVRDAKGRVIDPYYLDSILSDQIYRALHGQDTARQALQQAGQALLGIVEV